MAARNLSLMNQCHSLCTARRRTKWIVSGRNLPPTAAKNQRAAGSRISSVYPGRSRAHRVDRDVARQRPTEIRTSDERDDGNGEDRHQQIEGSVRWKMIAPWLHPNEGLRPLTSIWQG